MTTTSPSDAAEISAPAASSSSGSTPSSASPTAARPATSLTWVNGQTPDGARDPYHIATSDGRYTVCRLNVGKRVHYVAYRRAKQSSKRDQPHVMSEEIASIDVPRPKTAELERDDPAMKGAIRKMQQACLKHAGLT